MPRGQFDRSARKALTRERLLQAAASVYAQHGFGGATLDQVAAQAGFTKGAVYSHFGSKENLLLALLEEHLASQIAEQIALFERERTTRGRATSERPLAGSARWMERLEDDPDPLRLFVELWVYAQRDERLRGRLAGGLDALRATFTRFAAASAADAGIEAPPQSSEHLATVLIAMSIGLPMIRLIEPDAVPASLLGAVLSVLIRTMESSSETRELLSDPDRLTRASVA
jgi:AcrR family transcriptional regulator